MRNARALWLVGAACLSVVVLAAALMINQTRVSPEAIQSSVNRNVEQIDKAWSLPVASSFRRTITSQTNASLCGAASVANVMRSFKNAPVSEREVLNGTGLCSFGFCFLGLTLDELAEVAGNSPGRHVTVLRDLTLQEFRGHMKLSNDPRRRYIANFSRSEIFGAGTGHHSPIGGYLEDEDLVFVLDVNQDYQAWLVESARLFKAVNTLDGSHKRGLLLIE